MRSTSVIAFISVAAGAGIAAAQTSGTTPPAIDRVSVPWHQSGAHRATAIRAGSSAAQAAVTNDRVTILATNAPKANPTNPGNMTISRESDWDHEGDPVVEAPAPPPTPFAAPAKYPAQPTKRMSLISHDSWVHTRAPDEATRDGTRVEGMATAAQSPIVQGETGHLRAQPQAPGHAEVPRATESKKRG